MSPIRCFSFMAHRLIFKIYSNKYNCLSVNALRIVLQRLCIYIYVNNASDSCNYRFMGIIYILCMEMHPHNRKCNRPIESVQVCVGLTPKWHWVIIQICIIPIRIYAFTILN